MQFNPIPSQTFGNPPFQVEAVTDIEGLTPVYSTTTIEPIHVCSGNYINITSAGRATIFADFFDSEGTFHGRAWTGIFIYRGTQKLVQYPPTIVPDATGGHTTYLLSGESNVGLPVHFTSWDTEVATISGNYAHIIGPGSVVVSVEQSGNANYMGGRYVPNHSGTTRFYVLPF